MSLGELWSEAAAGPPLHRPRRPWIRLIVFAGVVSLLLAALGYAAGQLLRTPPADYPGPGSGVALVDVPPGASLAAIAGVLAHDGVVETSTAFLTAAAGNPRSIDIQAGLYRCRYRMSAAEALAVLTNPADLVRYRVTIPEGTSLKTLLPLLAAATHLPLSSFAAAVGDPAALQLPTYARGHVEGFLFPATYSVTPGTPAVAVLRLMVARFEAEAAAVHLVSRAAALGRTPLQVVIIASILERESAGAAEDPMAAEVFYNRLRAGLPLGSEFTVAYSGNDPASPYNTYTHRGFPPGAYDSPGQTTLLAALHPTPGPWRYFVTLPGGRTLFEDTQAGFFAAQAQCRALGGCGG